MAEVDHEYDIDKDGVVSDVDMQKAEKLIDLERRKIEIENQDKREDAQRSMAWFALVGMLMYPFSVVLASWLALDSAATILGNMAATYFVSVAAIVAAFYGTQAYATKK